MPRSTYYVQECPTCGRNLQVRVEYLGRLIVCQHCEARFEARHSDGENADSAISSSSLMKRVDAMITASESQITSRRQLAVMPK